MERNMIGRIAKSLTLKQMAWGLLILSVLDAWLTDLGLRTGIVYEANPLAARLYAWDVQHVWFYLIKTAMPLIVVLLSYRVQKRSVVKPLFWTAIIVYTLVLFFHLVWVTFYIRVNI